jgi:methyltransferase (TIGR00027 family)
MEGAPSFTALMSAFGRAYHSSCESPKIFDDFLARELIGEEDFKTISDHLMQGIKYFNPNWPDNKGQEEALKWVVQNHIAPITLTRSRYCEDMLENAVKFGCKQYVILGAGFDTLAFRRSDLADKINIFELDHPATQKDKHERIKKLGWNIPSSLHLIPVDFRNQQLTDVLGDSGFDNNKLSFFSWLGVTYYLSKEDIFKTLKVFADNVPEGSTIVFDYFDKKMMNMNDDQRAKKIVSLANATGETILSYFNYEEIETGLDKIGLLIYEHLEPHQIEERYLKGRTDDYHAVENTNFVLAIKKAPKM